MAAKIGILGENTTYSGSITTVYTVPSDKAAKVRIIFAVEGGGVSKYSHNIGSPGLENTLHVVLGSDVDAWSGTKAAATPDPADNEGLGNDLGLQGGSGALDLENYGTTKQWWISPLPCDYFLSTGDTHRFLVDSNADDHYTQCVGVEDDA